MTTKKRLRGGWNGNKFWEHRPQRKGFVFSFRGLRAWQKANPEEAKMIEERRKANA